MIYLKYATASQEIPLGYFLDSTDGDTEETGLTIANTDIKLWKAGASTLANKNSGGATHISNGIYYATLDATDTNTLGSMIIFVHVSGALTVRLECCVLPANIYDSWISGTDYQQVDTVEVSGDSTAADNCESFFDGTGYAGTNNIIPTVTNVGTCTTNTDMRGTDSANTTVPDAAGTAASLIGALNDITVADIIAGIADGSYDLQEMLRIMFSALAGKTNTNGTIFRDSADSKNRITATLDSNNNRTAMTLDGS